MSNNIQPTTTNIGSIYCVGRNYVAHAKELNNPIPTSPLIFTKVPSTIIGLNSVDNPNIELPLTLGRCDHETELVVRIDRPLYQANANDAIAAISHIGLALDLTLRDKQQQLKQQGHPWTLAKNFINATPISELIAIDKSHDLTQLSFELKINNQSRQTGNSKDMLFSISALISFISQNIPLQSGDIILTGTPEGVGPLQADDQIALYLEGKLIAQGKISNHISNQTSNQINNN